MEESGIHNHFEESLKECEGVGRAQSDAECNEIKECKINQKSDALIV